MSFSYMPPAHALVQRLVFAAAYAATTMAGISAYVATPVTIQGALGLGITYLWAALAIIGGVVGLAAVALDKWTVEMWSAPLATGGAAGYAVGVWSLVNSETLTRMTQASWITVLVLLLLARVVHVRATAAVRRNRHDTRQRLNAALAIEE